MFSKQKKKYLEKGEYRIKVKGTETKFKWVD